MASPDEAFVTTLDAASAAWTSGTNLFACPMRSDKSLFPTPCAFVYCPGGGEIINYCDGATNASPTHSTGVRVIVRSQAASYDSGRDLARAIRDAMHAVSLGSGYVSCRMRGSEPTYYGTDDDQMHLFGMDYDVIYSA